MEQPGVDSSILDRLMGVGEEPAPVAEAQEAQPQEDEQPLVSEETEEVAEETEETQEEATDDGLVELELEGKTVRVPPEIKEGYLRQSDYTRKTQELAQLQKQSLAAMQQQELVAKFHAETRTEQQELAKVKSQLEQYKQLDWTALDTDTYIKTRGYIDQLKDRATELEQGLSQKASSVKQEIEKTRAEAARNAYEFIARHVKDWTPNSDREKFVAGYAQNFGVPPEALAEISVRFPGMAVMAAKAAKYDDLQKGTMAKVREAKKAPPVVKPGATNSTRQSQEKVQKSLRAELKKTGSLDAAERLFLARMK